MTKKLFTRLDYIFGWVAFLVAAVVYMLTLEPTVSFWDCGEFISSSYKLEVGHPPGAPLFMLVARFFSLFAADASQVAFMVNAMSAIASAFTIAFLYWTIAYFARRMLIKNDEYHLNNTIAVISASLIGALAYTFSDTFWFSAVEGEVYATSSFFTAIVFWAMLKWNDVFDTKYAIRWIMLIALLIGLSIGVHLLNLLAIPAMVFIYYFRTYKKPTPLGIVIALSASLGIVAALMWGIIPGVAKVAAKFELLFINTMGMPYNTGVFVWVTFVILSLLGSIYFSQFNYKKYAAGIFSVLSVVLLGVPFMSESAFLAVILILALGFGIIYLAINNRKILNTIMIALTLVAIGYSCFALIIIRSNANPPMDQNNPDNVFSLLYYINREQYGDRPLFYGQYYYAEPTGYDQGNPVYVKKNGKYEIVDYKPIPTYRDSECTFFPRMFSNKQDPSQNHVEVYKTWGGIKGSAKPRFKHNLKFFMSYQINWMYWRYFMWNFAGRQNDIQGHGNIIHGNWKSGISFIDTPRLGDQDKLPDYLKNNKANNSYYMLPLLLGIIGIFAQIRKHHKDFWVVTLLFFLTGLAIVVYLNQTPYQPRERDYAYAGSFYAFSIWIGIGVLGIYQIFKQFTSGKLASVLALLLCLPVPLLMASENWDDHNRSNRYIAHDFAYNYLNSCEPNAILFTYGDNDTFPIWYAQEVEGIRTDVKVCCLPYFASDWYIDQMKMASYESGPMPLSLDREVYEPGARDIVYYYPPSGEERGYISVDSLMRFVENKNNSRFRTEDSYFYIYPHNKLFMRADSAKLVDNGHVKLKDADKIEPIIKFDLNRSHLFKNELLTLDMLATNQWERPVYFTSIGSSNTLNLDEYFQLEGFAYRLMPFNTGVTSGRIDSDLLYDRLMNTFKWGNMNDPDIYIDYTTERTTKILKIRRNFSRLAIVLARENKKDKAIEVMERAEEIMPFDIFVPGYFDVDFSDGWYAAGDSIKGDQVLYEIAKVTQQELDFYFSLPEKLFYTKADMETQMAIETLRRTISHAIRKDREQVYIDLEAEFTKYMEMYESKF
ncbi:MAG TPA: DUF2723 domain-containing protein [Bacteroidales bacterium]|nr:DUF2723 domain-containing protein [Bacteroidales bacterium]